MMHKIVYGNVAISDSIFSKRSRDISIIKFQPMYGRVNAYRNSFVPVTIKWWNNLPRNMVNETSFELFKSELKSIDITSVYE